MRDIQVVYMKKRFIIFCFLFVAAGAWSAEVPFSRGVNLTGWLQTSGPRQIQFSKYSKQDFMNIQSLGCDVIRLPINLHYMTDGEPDYKLDPLFLNFLDQIVNWAEELKIHLILDNHTFNPAVETEADVGDILIPVWTQLAEHYKNRSSYLYYEVLNEPHGLGDVLWNQIQQDVIDAIRTIDTTHTIIIGPASWNSYYNLSSMPVYDDEKLIYTFHFYDPFLFTHQGASWTDPSYESLAGVPFPYDEARMPECPDDLKGTYVEYNLDHYGEEGTEEDVRALIDIAAEFGETRDVPLFCGEFGVYIPNSPAEDRVYWYGVVRSYLEEKGIAWTIWDYQGGFGLFEAGTAEMFDYDLNIPLVEVLGLETPDQKEFILKPDSTGFDLYRDYQASSMFESSWMDEGIIDYYSENNPAAGRYCIYWTGAQQYNHIGFNFRPDKDMTLLVSGGYVLDFQVRGSTPGAAFDIRFTDTDNEDANDHPWRMRITMDESLTEWDNSWHHIQISLSDFEEHGAWDGEWFTPRGEFDWQSVDRFDVVAEHSDLKGVEFWFDDIRVIDPAASNVQDREYQPSVFKLNPAFPNPFNPGTTISYTISEPDHIQISIYTMTGRLVRVLVNQDQFPGEYTVQWNVDDENGLTVSSGLYVCVLKATDVTRTQKLMVLK